MGIDPVIEPDPANVQEPPIGAFKPVEQLLGRDVGSLRQKEGVYNPAVIERGAGIDVGKDFVAVCIMIGALGEEPRIEHRTTAR